MGIRIGGILGLLIPITGTWAVVDVVGNAVPAGGKVLRVLNLSS